MAQTVLILGARMADTDPRRLEDHLVELSRLLETLGLEPIGMDVQKLDRYRSGTYFGEGFLKQTVARFEPDLIAVEGGLSFSQVRNIEAVTGVPATDRTRVILEIFDRHARTREARVQVELARLRYQRTGLRSSDAALAQQVGAIGVRGGKGEKQIELDRRTLDKRIARLSREMKQIEKQRRLNLKNRARTFSVALVGYTNAGKSSLLNRLTRNEVLTDDRLFATLDTTSRQWFIPPDHRLVLSDTVGFIRNLPHLLVASFRSTFGVAEASELLLHVADLTSEDMAEQIEIVEQTLQEMGLADHPRILVLNKADAVPQATVDRYRALYPGSVCVSARTGLGLPALMERTAVQVNREMNRG